MKMGYAFYLFIQFHLQLHAMPYDWNRNDWKSQNDCNFKLWKMVFKYFHLRKKTKPNKPKNALPQQKGEPQKYLEK